MYNLKGKLQYICGKQSNYKYFVIPGKEKLKTLTGTRYSIAMIEIVEKPLQSTCCTFLLNQQG